MQIQSTTKLISFHHLHALFDGTTDFLQLKTSEGKGCVQFYEIEPGLQARLWNCILAEGLEMFCDEAAENKAPYFTLAYFLNKEGLRFANNNNAFQENMIWDTLFISSNSLLRMYVSPQTPVVCLNISFSKNWVRQHLLTDHKTHAKLQQEVFESAACAFLEYMGTTERELLLQLIEASTKKELSTLHLKSIVLKMLADFFNRLKEKPTLCPSYQTMNALLMETESLLCAGVKGAMPRCHALARQYGFSEVSLKRHFKHRYGVNMSTYFMHKKMEYAQQFMQENYLNETDAARLLGYKNVSHFTAMLQKYSSTIPFNQGIEEANDNTRYNRVV